MVGTASNVGAAPIRRPCGLGFFFLLFELANWPVLLPPLFFLSSSSVAPSISFPFPSLRRSGGQVPASLPDSGLSRLSWLLGKPCLFGCFQFPVLGRFVVGRGGYDLRAGHDEGTWACFGSGSMVADLWGGASGAWAAGKGEVREQCYCFDVGQCRIDKTRTRERKEVL